MLYINGVGTTSALRRVWSDHTQVLVLGALPGLAAVQSWGCAAAAAPSLELDGQTHAENCP